ncbi:MAG: hypothetical protein Q7J35_04475 [Candidatus Methanoperedens sp.]|nr:hypothetical protein [Candidatus Methanoperedens sp.]
MKKLDKNQLDEKEVEIADALISLGLGRPVVRTLAYLNNGEEATFIMPDHPVLKKKMTIKLFSPCLL